MSVRSEPERLGLYSLSFLRQPALRAVLKALGYAPHAGPLAGNLDAIAVWGSTSRAALRGARAAMRRSLPLVTLEEPFLCGIAPDPRYISGVLVDHQRPYYDASGPSDLEDLIAGDATKTEDIRRRAAEGLKLLRSLQLTKYNQWQKGALPKPGFVLVIDQRRDDASITKGRASEVSFSTMLRAARRAHPDLPIFIRRHPRAEQGHFSNADLDERTQFLDPGLNPWDCLAAAKHVYTVTSQMGLEAIFAGHKPHVFGAPFYAGWGLSHDQIPMPRRAKKRSVEQLFAATHLLYPKWYDAGTGALTDFESVARQIAREVTHWRRNGQPAVCLGLRRWKRHHVASYLKGPGPTARMAATQGEAIALAANENRRLIVWASAEQQDLESKAKIAGVPLWRVEDGFLRSVGLGADLFAPCSLVFDDQGIYYDPSRPSRLEALIAGAASLDQAKRARVKHLIALIRELRVSKYNRGEPLATIPPGPGRRVILVPGQVEDDASIRLGAGKISTNIALIRAVRDANPTAYLIYKPHPDVEAGLRPGALPDIPEGLINLVAEGADPADAIAQADEVWTMTSLLGFEALIRGKKVVTLGMPFYAGWGLTEDRGPKVYRRRARPSLEGLVHATLIDYPDYMDLKTGRVSTVERTIRMLAKREASALRPLAKLQRMGRKYSWIWRR